MCFKSKVKTPKTNPDALKAPEPVLLDEPKGVEYGDGESTKETGVDSVKIDKEPSAVDDTDRGDGSAKATAKDTGISAPKALSNSAVKRALKKK